MGENDPGGRRTPIFCKSEKAVFAKKTERRKLKCGEKSQGKGKDW